MPRSEIARVAPLALLLAVPCAALAAAPASAPRSQPTAIAAAAAPATAPPRSPHATNRAEPLVMPMREIGEFGGSFTLAITSGPRTLNPLMAAEASSIDVTDRLFTALAEFDNARQQYRPALARAWDLSADGRECTWHLRRGARFSDGHPMTSADVQFSFDVARDSALRSPEFDGLMIQGRPLEVATPDSYTVITRTPRAFALLVATVASVRIVPRHVLEPAWRAGRFAAAYSAGTAPESLVTSGAWTLARYEAQERVVLARNPMWYGVDARGRRLPYLDQLVFLIVPDQNTATLRFLAKDGGVDALDNVKPEDYAIFAKNAASGGFALHDLGATLTSNALWFNLNPAHAPGGTPGDPAVGRMKYDWFSKRDFRRAVSMALDRSAMIRSVYFGEGVPSWSVITPGNRVFFNPKAPASEYDPEGAKRLLAALGFRDRDGDSVIEDPPASASRARSRPWLPTR